MPIEWNDSLKTGVKIIDEQHQELIVMINRLGRLRCGRESFNDAFIELEEYASSHFKEEEEYMLSLNYPNYDFHKANHNKFVEVLTKYQPKIETAKDICELGEEIIDLVGNWFLKHYSEDDVYLADYIKNQNN